MTTPATPSSVLGRAGRTVTRTRLALRATLRRRDAGLVFVGVTVGYLFAYLYAIGDLAGGSGAVGYFLVDDPLARALEPTGTLSFEPVALLELGPMALLFSPVNAAIGLGLALLVGANLALTYLAWRQPAACGLRAGAGAVAGIPALLSGAACCGPVVLLVLGVQASGLLLAAFEVLVPVAVLLLVGSLLWVGRSVDPAMV